MDDLCGRNYRDDNKEVDWNNDGCKYAKGPDRSDIRACVGKERDGRRTRSHKDGVKRALPTVSHPFVQITAKQGDIGWLAPSITENEYIVCSDTKHNEYCHLVQCRVHSDLKDTRIDEVGYWEGEQDEYHRYQSQEQAFKVEHDVKEYE